jgi:hypothetical protein
LKCIKSQIKNKRSKTLSNITSNTKTTIFGKILEDEFYKEGQKKKMYKLF